MSELSILCDTQVTTAAGNTFVKTADGLQVTYNRIKEVNEELGESWEGKAGDYFNCMGDVVIRAIDDSKIFADESARKAFNIARRFIEIDDTSRDILKEDVHHCGLIDPLRGRFSTEGPNFVYKGQGGNLGITHENYGVIWDNAVGDHCYMTEKRVEVGGVSGGMCVGSDDAFYGNFLGNMAAKAVAENFL